MGAGGTCAVLHLWPLHLLETDAATPGNATSNCTLFLLNSAIDGVEEAGGSVEAMLVAVSSCRHIRNPSEPRHLGSDGCVQKEWCCAFLIHLPLTKSSNPKAALTCHRAVSSHSPVSPCLQKPAVFLARCCGEADRCTGSLRALYPEVEAGTGELGGHLSRLPSHLSQAATFALTPNSCLLLGHILLPCSELPIANLLPPSDDFIAVSQLDSGLECNCTSPLWSLLLLLLLLHL